MLSVLEKNKQYIFLGIIFLVIIIIIIYFSSKNGKLLNYVDDLRQRIEDLEETLQQVEKKYKIKSNDTKTIQPQSQIHTNISTQPPTNIHSMNIPSMNNPQMQPQINIPDLQPSFNPHHVQNSFNPPHIQPFNPPHVQPSFEQKKPKQQSARVQTPPSSPQIIPSKHISFNTEVEEIEPSDDENDDELDAEIADELKELEGSEEIDDETDLKIDE